MSAINDIDVTCDNCGEIFPGTIYTAIHAKLDPELKDLMLGGELNILMCTFCAHLFFYDHFLLYQDPASEVIAYIYPEKEREHLADLHKSMLLSYKEAQSALEPKDRNAYEPILIFGLENAIEFLKQEELDVEEMEVAEAICQKNGIPVVKIPPAEARIRKIPRVLPTTGSVSSADRISILSGIKHLLEINPTLTQYSQFAKVLEATPHWKIHFQ